MLFFSHNLKPVTSISVASWSFLIFFSVPSDVQNLTLLSNGTHILARWIEPESPNGALRYSTTLVSTDLFTGLTSDIVRDEVVFESEFELGFLVDFYVRYKIIVIPITGAGAGNNATDFFETDQNSE